MLRAMPCGHVGVYSPALPFFSKIFHNICHTHQKNGKPCDIDNFYFSIKHTGQNNRKNSTKYRSDDKNVKLSHKISF